MPTWSLLLLVLCNYYSFLFPFSNLVIFYMTHIGTILNNLCSTTSKQAFFRRHFGATSAILFTEKELRCAKFLSYRTILGVLHVPIKNSACSLRYSYRYCTRNLCNMCTPVVQHRGKGVPLKKFLWGTGTGTTFVNLPGTFHNLKNFRIGTRNFLESRATSVPVPGVHNPNQNTTLPFPMYLLFVVPLMPKSNTSIRWYLMPNLTCHPTWSKFRNTYSSFSPTRIQNSYFSRRRHVRHSLLTSQVGIQQLVLALCLSSWPPRWLLLEECCFYSLLRLYRSSSLWYDSYHMIRALPFCHVHDNSNDFETDGVLKDAK